MRATRSGMNLPVRASRPIFRVRMAHLSEVLPRLEVRIDLRRRDDRFDRLREDRQRRAPRRVNQDNASPFGGNVSILLGHGDGTFAATQNFPLGIAPGLDPRSLAIGDFDTDGKSDLAITDWGEGGVEILLNTGCRPIVTSIDPSTVPRSGGTVVTITGSNFVPGATTVSFGSSAATSVSCSSTTNCTATSPAGTGTVSGRATTANGPSADTAADDFTYTAAPATACSNFAASTHFAAGASPFSVDVGDFDRDGKSDLAVANQDSNDVSILLGNGDGTFRAPTNFAVGTSPSSVAVGDFNGDGVSDLAVANSEWNDVSILLGTGSASFGTATSYAVPNARAVAIGDFNGDGKSDLAVPNGSSISILLGTGMGTFGAPANFAAGTTPNSIAVGDFNGDGRLDLAAGNDGSNNVSILLGTGTGTFLAPAMFAVGMGQSSVAIGDFDGDGRSDVAVADNVGGSNDVAILLDASTPGTFAITTATASVNEGAGTLTVTVARTGGTDCSVSVDYATANGSASAGSDYTAASGTLTFGPGVSSQTFTVPITNDPVSEATETFTVAISNSTGGASLGATTTQTVTIIDDDPLPTLSIDSPSIVEGDSGPTNMTFTVTLSAASGAPDR